MIKKFSFIRNFAVFQNFEWDRDVRNDADNIINFNPINIIYGRNYSGKTSLSRILRAVETGCLSNKFRESSFCLAFTDGKDITESNYHISDEKIRVFNEDFVRKNLRFINDPDDNVEPFAILGEHNYHIEMEINTIENELGSAEEGGKTGLYAEQDELQNKIFQINSDCQKREKDIDAQLQEKATAPKIGIRNNSQIYGDQNYNLPKMKNDIQKVLSEAYVQLTIKQKENYKKLVEEKNLSLVSVPPMNNLQFQSLLNQAENLTTRKIGESNKIEELVNHPPLNRWVSEGHKHHIDKRDYCAFCGNRISENRWEELKRHFDEESEKLEGELIDLISQVDMEIKEMIKFRSQIPSDRSLFYSSFHEDIDNTLSCIEESIDGYLKSLRALISSLEKRKNDINNPQLFQRPVDFSEILEKQWTSYEDICKKSNEYTDSLESKQDEARYALRLDEVSNYIIIIKYQEQIAAIGEIENYLKPLVERKKIIEDEISKKRNLIRLKNQELADEEKGVQKVNEYLNRFAHPHFLSLESQDDDPALVEGDSPKIKFEIIRNNEKAYHLSEGECNLIAFCYFLARLEGVDTKDVGSLKPIIWIDDPVSSLDGNHIFFIYSLIASEIIFNEQFQQIFISTHSLEFLKYLRRLNGKFTNNKNEPRDYHKSYFMIVREGGNSTIQPMPKYLKEYATEFNFLFHQIYKCSRIERIDDENYITMYDFGNNARKFLEIYLYFKYPDQGMTDDTLHDFLGGKIPTFLTQRITNEYSHLLGGFERGAVPIELPEIQDVAKQIIAGVKKDEEQYKSLLSSIGEIDEDKVLK